MSEHGYDEALIGMGLSFGVTSGIAFEFVNGTLDSQVRERMAKRARILSGKGLGHDKFLRQIMTHIYIKAPLYWWKQMDQYKVGTTTTSESTMHTLGKRSLTQHDFEDPINPMLLDIFNVYIACGDYKSLNNELSQGFLQGRVWSGSYANILNIIEQREGHKLKQWDFFINSMKSQLKHPELIFKEYRNEYTH
jgi:hypothetical protein